MLILSIFELHKKYRTLGYIAMFFMQICGNMQATFMRDAHCQETSTGDTGQCQTTYH